MAETNEVAPLVALAVIGILTGGGWMVVLKEAPPEDPVETGPKPLKPASLPSGPTALDEAMGAIAKSSEQSSIRCAVDAAGVGGWPFEHAHHDGSLLRAIVRTERGSRLVWPVASSASDAPEPVPVGLLEWSGAKRGAVGGCRLVPTTKTRIEGKVMVDGKLATDVRVRVCGETLTADAQGAFTAEAWAGQHCLAYVSEPGVTQDFEPIVVPMEGPAKVSLDAERIGHTGSATLTDRRVTIPRRSWPERALRQEGLSPEARALLEDWARETLADEVTRTELSRAADALDVPPEAEAPTP